MYDSFQDSIQSSIEKLVDSIIEDLSVHADFDEEKKVFSIQVLCSSLQDEFNIDTCLKMPLYKMLYEELSIYKFGDGYFEKDGKELIQVIRDIADKLEKRVDGRWRDGETKI